MTKEVKEELAIRRKMVVLEYAQALGSVSEACRAFEVPRSSFYRWKKAFEAGERAGLARKKLIAHRHPRQLPPQVVEKILDLRSTYNLGPQRITCYLERYHNFLFKCLPYARAKRRKLLAEEGGTPNYSHAVLCQESSRPSHSGRCEGPYA